jgi:hypothetical protein
MRIQSSKPIFTCLRRSIAIFAGRSSRGWRASQATASGWSGAYSLLCKILRLQQYAFAPHTTSIEITPKGLPMIRKQWLFALLAAFTFVSAQRSALAQYGPPASGSSAAILFTPATLGLVAGLNGGGYSGDGAAATAAKLNFPNGLAYDSSGNLYIADSNNYVVRKVTTAGIISTVAGNNTFPNTSALAAPPANTQATSWALGFLNGLAVDSSNNLYFADRTYNVIWKVANATGYITVFAGSPNISGGYTGDGGVATSATLDSPQNIAFDLAGNLYIADGSNNVVRVVGTDGNIHTFAGNGTGAGVFGGCPASFSGAGGAATAASLCSPQGVAADRAGNVYISSYTYDQVYIVGTNGKINLYAGNGVGASSPGETYSGDGGAATSAQLWRPAGVYADPAGDVFIADQFGAFVREVNAAGTISTVYGIPNGGTINRTIIGIADSEANTLNLGDSDGNSYLAMDAQGDLIVSITDASAVVNAGAIGQYRFPQTQIYTTETTTQANAASMYYPASVTVSNPSGVTLNFTAAPLVTGPFAVVTGTGAGTCVFPSGSVAPGQSCTIVLSFTPTQGGSPGTTQTGTVVLASNANASPSTIMLSGVGIGVATVSATLVTSPLNFTSPAGVTSASQNVTLTNTGQIPITIGSTNFNFTSAANFALSGTTCPSSSTTLAVGASCTYSITFTPTIATTYTAGFQACITTSSYGCLQSISLNGTGTAAPTVTLQPNPLAFGGVYVGQTGTVSATLTNTSSSSISISGFTIGGTNPTDFAVSTNTNACGSTLAAGASCNVYVAFTPASATTFSGQLSVTDTAAGSPQTVTLSGNGIPDNVSPGPLVFNPAPVGISAASAQTLTATFTINGFGPDYTPTASLHYGLSYSITQPICSGTANSETCSVQVTFQPQYPGGRRDALFLTNGNTRLASVLIYGIGQSPFALLQPGKMTTPIHASSGANYSSIVDENGTAYVIQSGGNSVVSVTKAGVVTTLPLTGLNVPNELGIDGAGVLYIAGGTPLAQVTTYDTVQGIQGSVPYASTLTIEGLAVGNTGNLYETDGSKIYTVPISGTGTASTVTISPSVSQGYILASDSNDDIFVSGYTINELSFGGTQTAVNSVGALEGLGVDAAGTLYATRYSPTGGVAELPASGYGTAEASLDSGSPLGASVGPDGTVYVGNYNNLDKVDRSQGSLDFGQVGAVASLNASIYNGGNQPLTITNIAVAGTGFSFGPASTNPCVLNTPIAVGAICQIKVTLTSPNAGFYAGTLTLTDNSLNSTSPTQTVALTGMAWGNYLVATPASLNFGNQAIGTTSAPQLITLTNYGEGYNATVNPITGGGPFTFAPGTCTTPLAPATSATSPGGSCQLSVTFAPTTTTAYSNTQIGITATGLSIPNVVIYVSVSGTGTAATTPIATLAPTVVIFANTLVGSTSASVPVTLSNTGTGTLTGIAASLTGANASQFAISSTTCGSSLAASASCVINITFAPGSVTGYSASLSVADSATGSPQTLAISGAGIAGASSLKFSPTSISFSSTTVGVAATQLPVVVSNPGTAAVAITNISVGGANASSFGETNTCGSSVAAGGSCTITVSFTPGSAGALGASISVVDSATGSPQAIALSGTGAAVLVPQATLNPTSLTFASTTVGVAATTQAITLSNPGTGVLTVTGISVTGANASSFGQTNNCGISVAAGGSCTITVSFTPGAAGALAAAISVVDNAGASLQAIPITGTGAAVVTGNATFTVSSSTPSSSVQPGGLAQFDLVIAPVGGSYTNVVTLSATGLPAGAQASFLPASVTPGASGAPSVLSIQTATGLARLTVPQQRGQSSVPLLALLAGLPLLGFAGTSRRFRKSAGRWMLLCFAVLSILPLLALGGCGGGYFGPAPKTYTVTVIGTSGALQQSTTLSLTVQ